MKISLIIPCYNEETNIQKGVLDKFGNFTSHDDRFSEVLIVDDGSTDQTKKLIKNVYLPQFPKFRLIENKHQGKAFAVIKGIEEAKGDYAMFSDIDLATPLEESNKIIAGVQQGYEVVIGSRSSTRAGAPLSRKIMALGMIFLRAYFIGLKGVKDTQCGFKIFKKDAAMEIIKRLQVFKRKRTATGSAISAGFDLEFLFLAYKLKYKIKEIPVVWRHVETKNVTFVKSSLESLKDILLIKAYDLAKKYEI